MDKLYTATASAVGGRKGHASTSDGRLSVEITHPVHPNRPSTGTDPEQLFAAAYAACYGGAVEYVASQQGVTFAKPVEVTAKVTLCKTCPQPLAFGIEAELVVDMVGVDQTTADAICAQAHHVCPYSNAIRGNVIVTTIARAAAAAA